MFPIRDFVAGFARARKSFKEIQDTTEAAYGKNLLKKTQIYKINKAVKEEKTTVHQLASICQKPSSSRSSGPKRASLTDQGKGP
jgi:hypothetical protein